MAVEQICGNCVHFKDLGTPDRDPAFVTIQRNTIDSLTQEPEAAGARERLERELTLIEKYGYGIGRRQCPGLPVRTRTNFTACHNLPQFTPRTPEEN